jgi:hypothetical protein
MQDRSGPGVTDFGFKKETDFSAINTFRENYKKGYLEVFDHPL